MKEFFDPKSDMFQYNKEINMFWFNEESSKDINYFRMFGIVTGLAIYNNINVNMNLPFAFYKQLDGQNATLEDLKELLPAIGKTMDFILNYNDSERPLKDTLEMDFSRDVKHNNKTVNKPLIPDGNNIPVTEDNSEIFVELYIKGTFEKGCGDQMKAFKRGFN